MKMFISAVILHLSVSYASHASEIPFSIKGVELGMNYLDAVSEIRKGGLFLKFSGREDHHVQTNLKGDCLGFEKDKIAPCEYFSFSAGRSPTADISAWNVSEISYSKVFREPVEQSAWREEILQRFGMLEVVEYESVHPGTPIQHDRIEFGKYYGVALTERKFIPSRISGLFAKEFYSDDCNLNSKSILVTAYLKRGKVANYQVRLFDHDSSCLDAKFMKTKWNERIGNHR